MPVSKGKARTVKNCDELLCYNVHYVYIVIVTIHINKHHYLVANVSNVVTFTTTITICANIVSTVAGINSDFHNFVFTFHECVVKYSLLLFILRSQKILDKMRNLLGMNAI